MTQHAPKERFGGPGASHENARTGTSSKRKTADSGQDKTKDGQRNPHHSAISGGGGELDSHHTHDPKLKG